MFRYVNQCFSFGWGDLGGDNLVMLSTNVSSTDSIFHCYYSFVKNIDFLNFILPSGRKHRFYTVLQGYKNEYSSIFT